MKKRLALSVLLLAAGTSGVAVAAPATPNQPTQSMAQAKAQQPARPKSSDFSDSQVAAFAKAHAKVQAIKTHYLKMLKGLSKQPKKSKAMQMEAQQKMVKAVKDAGVKVGTYNKMAYALQYDKTLRQRVQKAG